MGAAVRFTPEERAAITQAALAVGDLRVIMTKTQRKANAVFEAIRATVTLFVIDCTRRWGKTYYAAKKINEWANAAPKRTLRIIAPTKLHGRQTVIPAFEWVFGQLPERMRPRFVQQDNTWIWPNGSVCHLGSAESMGDLEVQVGTACHGAVIDEAGKIRSDLLKHLVRSVLMPQFLTTGGNIIIASTPALTPAHYLTELVKNAQAAGALARYTIDDCDHIDPAARVKFIVELLEIPEGSARDRFIADFEACASTDERVEHIKQHGGVKSTEVLRELYCIRIADRSMMIVPEFLDMKARVVVERERPVYTYDYVSADLGFEDLSAVLFAYYDFQRAVIYVYDEYIGHRVSGLVVGHEVKQREQAWGLVKPERYADGTPQLLADLSDRKLGPGIDFGIPLKDDAEAALNQVRMLVQQRRIEIHPRCVTLITHLEFGVWNNSRTSFDRMDGFGHWDAIDALKYLVRMVDTQRNPFPAIMPGIETHTHHIPAEDREQMQRARQVLRF